MQPELTSYLGWPVLLREPFNELHAHITLKYLGEGHFTVMDLASRLKDQQTRFVMNGLTKWAPKVFDDKAFVFVLEGVDNSLHVTRKAVEDLRGNDHPWQPHIRFKRSTWTYMVSRDLRLKEVVEAVGPLMLFLDRKAVYTF